ncbi:hypothetical protein [Iodobacter ciconiae]|uniref:Uncharacterized protein n=1 Tax=Iodobacter ciconiae TaxID=2496266 RepID=A0A3S8ZVQ8_9NEIS|nr:hypothetical protein [Iodobacter ciconiae]AZN37587.1 hypothetical protein EJO50_14560 [Iodobacter ciconiae]
MTIKWIVIAFCTLLVGNTLAESSSKSYRGGFSSSRSSKPTQSKPATPQNAGRSESNTSFGSFGRAKKTDAQTAPGQSASNKSMSRAAEKDRALNTMNEREARARRSASSIYLPNSDSKQAQRDPYRQPPMGYPGRDADRKGSFGQSMAGSVLGSMLGNSISNSSRQQAQNQSAADEQSSGWLGVFFFGVIVFIIAFLILAFFLRKKSTPRRYSLGDR